MTVFEKIEAQQKGLEDTAIWMVGEQLKDICSREPDSAKLVAEDLEKPVAILRSYGLNAINGMLED